MKLNAAYIVYYKFWAKSLNAILRSVPKHHQLKYLTREQVIELKLTNLQYDEEVLLVRHEYKTACKAIWLDKTQTVMGSRKGGVIVTGQPGAGMHFSPAVISFTNIHYIQEKHAFYTTCCSTCWARNRLLHFN